MSFVLNTVHTCMYYMYRSSVEHFAIASAGFFKSYFFVKKYLLVGASSMLWTGQWKSESVSQ